MLRDPDADRRLRRDGFATVEVLERRRAVALRNTFGTLHGWDGSGFATDAWSSDLAYRHAASDAIATATDSTLDRVFDGHEPAVRSFVVKWPAPPGGGPLEGFPQTPHRDWTFTDEPGGVRSWVAWIALEDIDGDNGQLRVVRGSHRLDSMVRGTELEPSWRENDELWEPRLLSVPLRAGEAVVFDTGLFHCSHLNHTTEPRVAAAVVMRPRGAPLFHYRDLGAGRAARIAIDEQVLLQVRGDRMAEEVAALPIDAVVASGEVALTPRQIRWRLDTQPLNLLDRAKDLVRAVPSRSGHRTADAVAGVRQRVAAALRTAAAAERQRAWSPDGPVGDPRRLPWTAAVEAAHPRIRAEVESLLAERSLPEIDEEAGRAQGAHGAWRAWRLMEAGEVLSDRAARLPATASAMAQVPGAVGGGLSLLEPGTVVPPHTGPDDGILRYHLGVIVPGDPTDYRLRVGDRTLHWEEGASLVFDDGAEHAARSDGEADRVVLVIDVSKPWPRRARALARVAAAVDR